MIQPFFLDLAAIKAQATQTWKALLRPRPSSSPMCSSFHRKSPTQIEIKDIKQQNLKYHHLLRHKVNAITYLQTLEKHSSSTIGVIAADYRSFTRGNFGCSRSKLLCYQSRCLVWADYSINLLASTRLRRRSYGKPCVVCKIGRAPTAIVIPAQLLGVGKEAGESSVSFGSPQLKQKGIKRPCTRALERRYRHVGSLLTDSAGFTFRDGVVGWPQRAVLQLGGVWFGCVSGSPDLTQNGTQRPCTKAWERGCWHVRSLLTASAGLASGDSEVGWLQRVVLWPGDV